MKITKKEIYAGFGIEYKAGKINYPIYGMKRPILKNGNAKVGKTFGPKAYYLQIK